MQLSKLKRLLATGCCVLATVALAAQRTSKASRIYVEAFATRSGAEKIHDDLVAELGKVRYISLVPDEANADLVMDGGGEIWIKGYRSFSPRSHMKLPANGMPIYGGFLSVELKNRRGITIWSYLATPSASSQDVPKDIAKQIAKALPEAVSELETPVAPTSPPHPSITLCGAGATFPYPVYQKWFENYHAQDPATNITYNAVGSEAGIRELLAGTIDFGASDSPEAIHGLVPDAESRYVFFPSVVGAVVPIVNLPDVPQSIAFTPEALAGIFLGKIRNWNDPILQRANRRIKLPDLHIAVIHRSEGSGTSYAWTEYLSRLSPEWKAEAGASLTPKWPSGRAAIGNDGVAKLVAEIPGSIGYVEFIYALQHHLSYGSVRNQNGEFVQAGLESIAAAVSHSTNIREDFKASIVDVPGEGSYPIASFTWLVVPTHIADEAKRNAIRAFLSWMVGPGQRQAAALGYLALPKEIVTREEALIAKVH